MTTEDNHDPAKKKLAEQREARAKTTSEQAEKMANSKPTPTQEENDLAASGVHVVEHEDDGSGPEPKPESKHLDPKKPTSTGSYPTRTMRSGSHPASGE